MLLKREMCQKNICQDQKWGIKTFYLVLPQIRSQLYRSKPEILCLVTWNSERNMKENTNRLIVAASQILEKQALCMKIKSEGKRETM